MNWELAPEVGARLTALLKQPLARAEEQALGTLLERSDIEALLPHRGQALLLERACVLRAGAAIVARHRLEHSAVLLSGHFPGQPVWPGVQQIEAIGQAGALLARHAQQARGALRLVSVLAARFVAPVEPPEPVEVQAALLADGLFSCVVGQCLQHGTVRSVAALRLLLEEE